MREVSIEDALQYSNGEKIPSIQGVIVWAGEQQEFDDHYSDSGKVIRQKILLSVPDSDRDTPNSSIQCSLKNPTVDAQTLKGNQVRFTCRDGGKGLYGVVKSVRDGQGPHAGKVFHQINISVPHEIIRSGQNTPNTSGGSTTQAASESSGSTQPQNAQANSRATQTAGGGVNNPMFVNSCMKMACEFLVNEPDGPVFDAQQIHGMTLELMKIQVKLENTQL